MAIDTFQAATGTNQYVVIIRPSDGAWWNTSGTPAFEAFNASNYTNYDIAATEFGSTGLFQYTIPATLSAGVYNVASKKRAGGSPAASDTNGPAGQIYWDGSAVISLGGVTLATPAETSGRPTTLGGMMRRLFEGRHNKRTRNRTTGVFTIRNAADDGNLETSTQSTASSTDTQTQGA